VNPDFAIFFDGGHSVGRQLAVGAVVCTPAGEVVVEQAVRAGEGTSNVAEYRALSFAVCMANLVGARRPLSPWSSSTTRDVPGGENCLRRGGKPPLRRAGS
jgi:hypothetical protein